MENNKNTTHVEHVLEFVIFMKKELYISSDECKGKKYKFVVVKKDTANFICELRSNPADYGSIESVKNVLNNKILKVNIGYRNKLVTFETKLVEVKTDKNSNKEYFIFQRTNLGIKSNLRPHRRLNLKNEEYLSLRIIVTSQLGSLVFQSRNVDSISNTAIAAYFNRKDGIIMPGDRVEELCLYKRKQMILKTKGDVVKIDSGDDNQKGLFFCVIKQEKTDKAKTDDENSKVQVKRESERMHMLGERLAYIDCPYPLLDDYHVYGHVMDLSKTGISFVIKKTNLPFMEGMIINDVYIQLPYQRRISVDIKILYCLEFDDNNEYSYKIGAEFAKLTSRELNIISEAKQRLMNDNLMDATREHHEELWEYFFETKFIYPEKREQIQRYADKILDTNYKLLTPSPIFKSIIYKDKSDNYIKGYISAVKFFDNTWLVQHLSGRKTESVQVGKLMYYAMMDYFLDTRANIKTQANYITGIFRSNNPYMALIMGDMKKHIRDSNIYEVYEYQFCTLKDNYSLSYYKVNTKTCICADADVNDLKELERLLLKQGYYSMIRAEGLNYENILNLKVEKEFKKLGLYRYRKVFVVKNRNTNIAFAVCNYASPGINFSEYCNSFKIYYSTDKKMEIKMINALCCHVIRSYSNTELKAPVCLKRPDDILPGMFEIKKVYSNYVLDTRYFPHYKVITDNMFSHFISGIREHEVMSNQPKLESDSVVTNVLMTA